jgi:hypothetical protein
MKKHPPINPRTVFGLDQPRFIKDNNLQKNKNNNFFKFFKFSFLIILPIKTCLQV